jgi:hypothetical protein
VFLSHYKKLVTKLEQAQTVRDLVEILCISSGDNLFPSIIFDQNGQLKTFNELRNITYQQLSLIIKKNTDNPVISLLLLVNIERDKQRLLEWEITGNPMSLHKSWFIEKFKIDPISCEVVRIVLMQNNIYDLRFFITKNREPRTDLLKLISEIYRKVVKNPL